MPQIFSIRTVKYASTPFRSHVWEGQQKTFLAVCWLIVLAPRMRVPLRRSSNAFRISVWSKPLWSKNRWSSLATTAFAISGEISSRLRQRQIPKLRRTLGVVFQDFRLIERKTVYENVAFAMRIAGKSPKEIKRRVSYVLDLVGILHKARRKPSELSGGEQQRVAIARALVNNPQTIIADEPTGNLDPDRSLEIMMLLERINDLGTTVIVVTHEKELVDQFDKRVVAIDGGLIISDQQGGYFQYEQT